MAVASASVAPRAQAETVPQMYWANMGSGTIGAANIDGTSVNQSFITGADEPQGVVVDGQHIYWGNNGSGTIGVANLDGSAVNQSFITGTNDVGGLAVDGQHIYWANEELGTIGAANLDGSDVNESFITGVSGVTGVAVDGQHIYWGNAASDTIGVANLDGTGVNQNFITGASQPQGVVVDGQHIYWANSASGTIGVANLDGTGVNQNFITGADVPVGVEVDGQHIYWTNYLNGTVGMANADGTDVNQSLFSGASSPMGVWVSVPVSSLSVSSLSFPAIPQQALSAGQAVTITNTGQRDLSIDGLAFGGSDPGDFAITSNGCQGVVAPGESCQFSVAFAPQGQGRRSATLSVYSSDFANSPQQITLTGTGGSLPTGPTGARGPMGPTGPQPHDRSIAMIRCQTRVGHRAVRIHDDTEHLGRVIAPCSLRILHGTVVVTGASASTAILSRGGHRLGRGTLISTSPGRFTLLLSTSARLEPGRYTLTSYTRSRRHTWTRRATITLAAGPRR